MEWWELESLFSSARLERYKSTCKGNERLARAAYCHNLLLSEALTPLLCTFEIALRNAVHQQLSRHYRRADWWKSWQGNPRYARQLAYVERAHQKLKLRREPQTPDKVVAELTFGFWSTLFNAEYHTDLWPPLRKAFPNCPKARRKRASVSAVVNRVRILRNRTFHHEPILWSLTSPDAVQREGRELLCWIHEGLDAWVAVFNRAPQVWRRWKAIELEAATVETAEDQALADPPSRSLIPEGHLQ